MLLLTPAQISLAEPDKGWRFSFGTFVSIKDVNVRLTPRE